MAEGVAVNNNTRGYVSWLRIEDFNFSAQEWPPPGERLIGWPTSELFLENVRWLAA